MLALGGLDDKFINSRGSLVLNIDHDSNDFDELLQVGTDGGSFPLLTLDEEGDLDVEGSIDSYAGSIVSRNPSNTAASVSLSWFDFDDDGLKDTARLRYGGNGLGNHGGFAIQKTGDSTLMRILDDGEVGLGTIAPGYRLTVRDPSHQIAIVDSANEKTWTMTTVGDLDLGFYEDGATQRMLIEEGGNVGIGTSDPLELLDVEGGDVRIASDSDVTTSFGTGSLIIQDTPGVTGLHIDKNEMQVISGTNDAFRINPDNLVNTRINNLLHVHTNGNVGIGVTTPSSKLDVAGTTTTEVLTITGGGDLSERFDIEGTVEPGTVVSIDPDKPGRLRVSSRAYDRTVAGIVSGANGIRPGMTMGQDDSIADGAHPVALTGRVYVKCAGPIEPGDLLTTSERAGYAMKVTDHGRAQGAIIGKAMTRLEGSDGLVLVLVTLQ
jgi:hypothetical protein